MNAKTFLIGLWFRCLKLVLYSTVQVIFIKVKGGGADHIFRIFPRPPLLLGSSPNTCDFLR